MADYCKQCAEEIGFSDTDDLAYLVTEDQAKSGLFANVTCEDCGVTIVNHKGECMSKTCDKEHGEY